ncbi:M24 family metallopeptidase, partial [Klebsiella pneumoniae]|nr:M24 family metallopeptidase [Klebsiella pneumoniae]
DAAFAHIIQFIKPGMAEIEVSNELEFFMRRAGATSSSFDTIVASGVRSALPHGVASDKKIELAISLQWITAVTMTVIVQI